MCFNCCILPPTGELSANMFSATSLEAQKTFDKHKNSGNRKKSKKYTYSHIMNNDNNDYIEDIRMRIVQARAIFIKVREVISSCWFRTHNKNNTLICVCLLYSEEAWTLKKGIGNYLEAFEMWIHKRTRTNWYTKSEIVRSLEEWKPKRSDEDD